MLTPIQLIKVAVHLEKIERWADSLKESFLHFTFPTTCLHCSLQLPPSKIVLCSSCSSLLEKIDPNERCKTCFNLASPENSYPCQECLTYPSIFNQTAAVFDYEGPAASMVKRLKYGNQTYLSAGMAACMTAQFYELKWPSPDVIVPVPLSLSRWFRRGYNQSELLADEIGKALNRPVWKAIKKKSGDFSQTSLTYEQRKSLDINLFTLKSGHCFKNKIVLLIDDVMTTGSTLRRCGEILKLENCGLLYGLTFCRTLS